MFCPSCGAEEKNRTQFCRGCGAELRLVRAAIQQPEASSLTAITAREEITRAIASKIKELEDTDDLKGIAENVLPQIEKFLESPEERRLRRMRAGVITSAVGLGAAIFFLLSSAFMKADEILPLVALGITTFLIGVGIVVNGKFFSRTSQLLTNYSGGESGQKAVDQSSLSIPKGRIELPLPVDPTPAGSVVEHTTKHLSLDPLMPSTPRNTRE